MDLYIHKDIEDKFSKETHKNPLINNLLRKHYAESSSSKLPQTPRPSDEEPRKAVSESKITKPSEKIIKFCKHNQVIGMCKQGCK